MRRRYTILAITVVVGVILVIAIHIMLSRTVDAEQPETKDEKEWVYYEDDVVVVEDKIETPVRGKNPASWIKNADPEIGIYKATKETYDSALIVPESTNAESFVCIEQTEYAPTETVVDTQPVVEYTEAQPVAVAETQPVEPAQEIVECVSEPETVVEAVAFVDEQPASAEQSIEERLRIALESAGIGWWFPYACAQMLQESGGNPWAVNPNGLDYGLFQFRILFWDEPESIYDVGAQIRKYVSQVSARISAGLSVEEIISRHYTSDYVTEINWEYVRHVLSRMR